MTARETLTALFDLCYEALARWGCGHLGLPYDKKD
jgi:hypothetical protein